MPNATEQRTGLRQRKRRSSKSCHTPSLQNKLAPANDVPTRHAKTTRSSMAVLSERDRAVLMELFQQTNGPFVALFVGAAFRRCVGMYARLQAS